MTFIYNTYAHSNLQQYVVKLSQSSLSLDTLIQNAF